MRQHRVGIKGPAMTETPTVAAHAILHLVRVSPSFLFHLHIIQTFYHTFQKIPLINY